jgi:hypothetical protein
VTKKVEQSFFKKFLILVSLGHWFQIRKLQYESLLMMADRHNLIAKAHSAWGQMGIRLRYFLFPPFSVMTCYNIFGKYFYTHKQQKKHYLLLVSDVQNLK